MPTNVRPTTYTVRLKDRQEVAERTFAVWLDKPAGFTFAPGQFAEIFITVPQGESSDEEALAFSMANAPDEDSLIFATRQREGAFKHELATMSIGSEVKVEGPFGKFVLHEDASRPAVFLALGIGITPVRSIVVHAATVHLPHKIFLFYSNRRPEDAAFLGELQSLESANENYRFIGTMTQMHSSKQSWDGETGHINFQMIKKHATHLDNAFYYVVGPPSPVKVLRTMLADSGVKKEDIRSEDFVGY